MPNKVRIIQKKWQVLTRPYINYNNSAVVVSSVTSLHPCQDRTASCPQYSGVVNGNNAWTVYAESTSFAKIKAAVREVLYEVGLKKEHIQVIELIDHDYIITPLT